jgi:ethanolamine utilization protein EutS
MAETKIDKTTPRIVMLHAPNKQITMAHLIAKPTEDMCKQVGVENQGAVGIMTITPGEGTMIAADIAKKAGQIKLEFVDRFTGCLVFSGKVAAVRSSLTQVCEFLENTMGFYPCDITNS